LAAEANLLLLRGKANAILYDTDNRRKDGKLWIGGRYTVLYNLSPLSCKPFSMCYMNLDACRLQLKHLASTISGFLIWSARNQLFDFHVDPKAWKAEGLP